MAGTYTCLQYHLVFSTKDRLPLITPEIQNNLYAYLGGIVRGKKGVAYQIGGISDHIHMLVRLHQDTKIQDFLRDVKSESSGWIHRTHRTMRGFAWQDGYGAFTVSMSQSNRVKTYIANQLQHHQKRGFKDEFRGFLRAHQIEFDEEKIWL
ncbi:MAG: IS200/IS605 family transposase [Candidatus Sumerlaeia bacterium]